MHICKCGLTAQPGNCLPIPTLRQCMCSFLKTAEMSLHLKKDISSGNAQLEQSAHIRIICDTGRDFPNILKFCLQSLSHLLAVLWFCGETLGKVVVILVEKVMQRLVEEQDGYLWLAVLDATGLRCSRHRWCGW